MRILFRKSTKMRAGHSPPEGQSALSAYTRMMRSGGAYERLIQKYKKERLMQKNGDTFFALRLFKIVIGHGGSCP